jgi:hypothetical protein
MAIKTGKVVILDANVLYPAPLRSFLLYLAYTDISAQMAIANQGSV